MLGIIDERLSCHAGHDWSSSIIPSISMLSLRPREVGEGDQDET